MYSQRGYTKTFRSVVLHIRMVCSAGKPRSHPPPVSAAFVVHVDVPRDKYGDEFDAVRERTSSIPFQVRCLRSTARVLVGSLGCTLSYEDCIRTYADYE